MLKQGVGVGGPIVLLLSQLFSAVVALDAVFVTVFPNLFLLCLKH